MKQIQWLEWGKESFEKARTTGKPILLDIKGSWCHWCHVMDSTSYSDPAIIDTVNQHFIPVRVDTDKRPDVNRRYNMGGWPTTAFLDGDGKIITGGTYIPPQQMREVLRSVLDHYAKNKGKIRSKLEPRRISKANGEPLTEGILKDIGTTIAVNFDIDYGGFGFEPKFPHTDALEYALVRYKYYGEKEMLTIVNRTLDKMGRGGIYDRVEGGFFRYSTTRDWSVPHFEKMAEDNARLLAAYIHASQTTGNTFFKDLANGIVRYVQTKLSEPEGGFYGSQDADEEYYKHNLEDRRKLTAPSIDRTFYTNYNAMFISSFLHASIILGKPDLARFAVKSFNRMLDEAVTPEGVWHYYPADGTGPRGLLTDHAHILHTMVDLYEHRGDPKYLRKAEEVADLTIKTLHDNEGGAFYDIPASSAELGELKLRDKPLDENSMIASALLRLSSITGAKNYSEVAEKTLKTFVGDYERHGMMAASYALALDLFLNGPIAVHLVGPSKGKETEKFRVQALKIYPARRNVTYLDPARDSERIARMGYSTAKLPTAYVCVGRACGPPLNDPSKIEESIQSLLTATPVQT